MVYAKADGTTRGLISAHATAPTVPDGTYTFKARIGWIRTDGTGNKYPLAFKQSGRNIQYVVTAAGNITALPAMSTGAQGNAIAGTYVSVSVSNYVPTTAAKIGLVIASRSTSVAAAVCPNGNYGAYNAASNSPFLMSYGSYIATGEMNLESTNVYTFNDSASGSLMCTGWEDNL